MMEAKQRSVPPKAPEIDLKSAVEWAFEAAQQSNDTRSKAAKTVLEDAGNQYEIQAIFSELVEKRAKGLHDFALELSLGLTPKKWTTVCRETVQSIGQAANTLKRTELADVLTQFKQQLDEANQQLGPIINPSLISELNNSYAKLAQQMPDSFGVGNTPSERERLLVETLLLQVPGVGRSVIKQIDSKQMAKYRELCTADTSAIAHKVGIDETVANAISENFMSFQKDREATEPNSRIERAHQKLEELAQQLDSRHRDFCQADDDDDSKNKRNARRAQATTSAQIDVLLADIAELELLKSLKPLPFQKKIEAIKAFLDQTASQLSQARESSPASKEVSG